MRPLKCPPLDPSEQTNSNSARANVGLSMTLEIRLSRDAVSWALILKAHACVSCRTAAGLTRLPSRLRVATSARSVWLPARSSSPLFSSPDQHRPNPTWRRRKLALPWSALNRRTLLFCSTARWDEVTGGGGGFCSDAGLELALPPRATHLPCFSLRSPGVQAGGATWQLGSLSRQVTRSVR